MGVTVTWKVVQMSSGSCCYWSLFGHFPEVASKVLRPRGSCSSVSVRAYEVSVLWLTKHCTHVPLVFHLLCLISRVAEGEGRGTEIILAMATFQHKVFICINCSFNASWLGDSAIAVSRDCMWWAQESNQHKQAVWGEGTPFYMCCGERYDSVGAIWKWRENVKKNWWHTNGVYNLS